MTDTEKTKIWKKKLAELLKEHPDIDPKMTGKVEVHFNVGGVAHVFINKELK